MEEKTKESKVKTDYFDEYQHINIAKTEKLVKDWTFKYADNKGQIVNRADVIVTNRRLVTVASQYGNITRTSYSVDDIRAVRYSIEKYEPSKIFAIACIVLGAIMFMIGLFNLVVYSVAISNTVADGVTYGVGIPWGYILTMWFVSLSLVLFGVYKLLHKKNKHSVSLYIYLKQTNKVSLNEVGITSINKGASVDRLIIHYNDREMSETIFDMVSTLDNIIFEVQDNRIKK